MQTNHVELFTAAKIHVQVPFCEGETYIISLTNDTKSWHMHCANQEFWATPLMLNKTQIKILIDLFVLFLAKL
jgi:hypothetical protein